MLENKYFWSIVTIFTTTLELVILNKILFHTSELKVSKLVMRINLLIMILFIIFINFVNVSPNYRVIISIIISMVYYIVNYNEKIIKAIIVVLVYFMMLIGIDAVSVSIVVGINNLQSLNSVMHFTLFRFQLITLSKCSLVIISFIYYKIIKNINLDIINDISYIIIPILANIASFLTIYKYLIAIDFVDAIKYREIFLISMLLLFSNISLIFSIRKIINDNKIISETKLISEKISIEHNYYQNIKDEQLVIKKLYHDINNHIACIKALNDNNHTLNYISSLENEIRKYNLTFDTGNIFLDVILSEKSKLCNKNNISLFIDVNNFDKCSFIESIDVCSIFSNLLDNAIEACVKVENLERKIILRGTIVNNFYVIKLENTKQNKININNNFIKTDKKDKYFHGIGLVSVRDSLSKYNGELAINYDEFLFKINIFIPLVPK